MFVRKYVERYVSTPHRNSILGIEVSGASGNQVCNQRIKPRSCRRFGVLGRLVCIIWTFCSGFDVNSSIDWLIMSLLIVNHLVDLFIYRKSFYVSTNMRQLVVRLKDDPLMTLTDNALYVLFSQWSKGK